MTDRYELIIAVILPPVDDVRTTTEDFAVRLFRESRHDSSREFPGANITLFYI